MVHRQFSKKEAVLVGWNTFKKNWKFLIGVFLVAGIVQAFQTNIQSVMSEGQVDFQNGFFWIIGVVVQSLVQIGLVVISLKLLSDKKAYFKDLVAHYRFLLPYIAVMAIFMIISLLISRSGPFLILIFVPVLIYFGIRLQFYPYFIIDKKMGAIDSLKASYNMTKGKVWNLFLLGLMFVGIALAGFLALVVGIFVAWPVISLASAHVYKKLQG